MVTIRPDETVLTRQSLPNFVGIGRKNAGATGLSMNLVVIPPGAKAKAHYHQDFETAIYVLEGEVETRYGLGLAKSVINRPGDFLFIPPSVPHQPVNLSAEKPARAIVARSDADEQENAVPYDVETGQ
ncbi:MAG: cupin domain-containing protein [Geminicoccaceae bacterium]